jgi:hypothetical protein
VIICDTVYYVLYDKGLVESLASRLEENGLILPKKRGSGLKNVQKVIEGLMPISKTD